MYHFSTWYTRSWIRMLLIIYEEFWCCEWTWGIRWLYSGFANAIPLQFHSQSIILSMRCWCYRRFISVDTRHTTRYEDKEVSWRGVRYVGVMNGRGGMITSWFGIISSVLKNCTHRFHSFSCWRSSMGTSTIELSTTISDAIWLYMSRDNNKERTVCSSCASQDCLEGKTEDPRNVYLFAVLQIIFLGACR